MAEPSGTTAPRTPAQQRSLAIYLNDHLAALTGGVELARRAAGAERDTPLGPPLRALAEALHEDREGLRSLMNRLGAGVTTYKVYAGWAAEKVGRLKLNGSWVSRSPLAPVVEIEGLRLVVEHLAMAGRALRAQAGVDAALQPAEIDRLVERAVQHGGVLERLHGQAVAQAFGGPVA